MSFVGPLLVLALTWAAIHALRYFFTLSRSNPLSLSASNTFRFRGNGFWDHSTTQVSVKSFHLRLQTTAWNFQHDILATELRRERSLFLSQALKGFYDLGSAFGMLGMLAGLVLLSWSCGLSTLSLTRKITKYNAIPSSASPGLARRGLEGTTILLPEYESFIKPIIPGLTVPPAHLPLILIAVFLAQIVHEFGHAITAALESVPLLSTGASFTFAIPSAFVTLSAASLAVLPPRRRLRVIAAGPFHNILLWSILFTMKYMGLGCLFWTFGYRDMSTVGRIVIRVDPSSSLHAYLPPATIITKLDDIFLGSNQSSKDMWTSYLNESGDRWGKDLGWCVEAFTHPELCCANENSSGLSCFRSTDEPSHRGCIDPIPILTLSDDGNRCFSTSNCVGGSVCVRPDKTEPLLRLTVHRPSSLGQDVVLWSGPLREVWEQIDVGILMPRLNILPLWLPTLAQNFWEYLVMATLSLYIFNLLPLPLLDGLQFLITFVEMAWGQDNGVMNEYDLEALAVSRDQRTRSTGGNRWSFQLANVVPKVTIVLLAGCLVLETINTIL